MKNKEMFWVSGFFLASGLFFAGLASAAGSGNGRIVNNIVAGGSSTAVAVGPGSHAMAGGISINGQNVTAGNAIQDIGVKDTELRSLPSYRSIEIGNFPGKIVVRFNKKNNAVVTADQAIVPAIRTTVKDGTLFVGIKESISTRTALQLRLNTEEISLLRIIGVADVVLEDVATDRLRLEIDGSGEIIAHGKVRKLEAVLSGSGDFKLNGLEAEQCSVRISGSGDAAVHVTGVLNAEVNGAGDIVYSGNPFRVIKNINGAGEIEPVSN